MEQEKLYRKQNGLLSATEKLKTQGRLGITAEDHTAFKSSPPDLLLKNPGKTLGEIMTDEEILVWIRDEIKSLTELLKNRNSSFGRGYLLKTVLEFKASLDYLNKLKRLPKEFENFNLESLR